MGIVSQIVKRIKPPAPKKKHGKDFSPKIKTYDYGDEGVMQSPKIKSNKKKKYDSISKQVNDFKVKKGCVMCGYNENPIALDFHHFNKKMKENNVSSFFKSSWKQFEKIKDEIKKCEVYCANCHRIEEHRLREEQRLKEDD